MPYCLAISLATLWKLQRWAKILAFVSTWESCFILINQFKVTIGRSSKTAKVDIDLSGYDLNKKISRNQCSLSMVDAGVFYLYNNGKLPVYVDGKPMHAACKTQVYDKSIIEVNF